MFAVLDRSMEQTQGFSAASRYPENSSRERHDPMITKRIKDALKAAFEQMGYEITGSNSLTHMSQLRLRILEQNRINLMLDIGAGEGNYILRLRKSGFQGQVVSFEPMKSVFEELRRKVSADPKWSCHNLGIGSEAGEALINVSANSVSSSLLPITGKQTSVVEETGYIATERITVETLDRLRGKLVQPADRVFLRLDVQGFEKQALLGAAETLPQVHVIESELSLAPLYEGQPLYREMIGYFENLGFDLMSLERGFFDYRTGQLLQMDGIFVRRADIS